jgi:hypothetical protein
MVLHARRLGARGKGTVEPPKSHPTALARIVREVTAVDGDALKTLLPSPPV